MSRITARIAIALGALLLYLAGCVIAGVVASFFSDKLYAVLWIGEFQLTSQEPMGRLLLSIAAGILLIAGVCVLKSCRSRSA